MTVVDAWLLARLRCPATGAALTFEPDGAAGDRGRLVTASGLAYAVVHGIPILLRKDVAPTHGYFEKTFDLVERSAETRASVSADDGEIDPFVQQEIVKTCGLLYTPILGRLTRYPIPELRLSPGGGRPLLDVGANWGRWSIGAAKLGYRAVAVDPSLEAALAAKRVARQLGVAIDYVVADARHLPFAVDTFDVAFSYSVLQHFAKPDAKEALAEMSRVTRRGGAVLVQMPNVLGARQAYNRVRQILKRDRNVFRVRYWTPWELRRDFARLVGPSEITVDGFFSLNPQTTDVDLLPRHYKAVVWTSNALRRVSERAPLLGNLADSLYVRSTNERAFETS